MSHPRLLRASVRTDRARILCPCIRRAKAHPTISNRDARRLTSDAKKPSIPPRSSSPALLLAGGWAVSTAIWFLPANYTVAVKGCLGAALRPAQVGLLTVRAGHGGDRFPDRRARQHGPTVGRLRVRPPAAGGGEPATGRGAGPAAEPDGGRRTPAKRRSAVWWPAASRPGCWAGRPAISSPASAFSTSVPAPGSAARPWWSATRSRSWTRGPTAAWSRRSWFSRRAASGARSSRSARRPAPSARLASRASATWCGWASRRPMAGRPGLGRKGFWRGPASRWPGVRHVDVTEPVAVGDAVYTASGQGILPQPLLYGFVVRVQRPVGAAHWEIWMKPALDSEPESVVVLRTQLNPARVDLGPQINPARVAR